MHKFLIPFVACLFGTATLLHAQVPTVISIPGHPSGPSSDLKMLPCNFAGTFTLGAFVGQSNDTGLDTIYLCEGDQITIVHNGDFDLSGDPNAATPPGIGYLIYSCAPTIVGDNLQNILTNEPCLYLDGVGMPIFAPGSQANGNITLTNNGTLQTFFNGGQPVLLHFAPTTQDAFGVANPYESQIVGAPPGPCVNVNTAAAFQVVYLNEILEGSVSSNFGNDCLGKFRITGGYPEFDLTARYTVDISLASNSNVKALIHNPPGQIGHNADIIFSVSQAGVYNVTIEDGKSCGRTFQVAMNACNSIDNIIVALPDTVSPPGSQICIPVTVDNFQLVGASFSLSWDPTVLSYNGFQNPSPFIGTFNNGNLNTQGTAQGQLGLIIYDQDTLGQVINIPDGGTLLELCFNVIGPLGACSGLNLTSNPTQIGFEDVIGAIIAVTVDTGQFCVGFLPLDVTVEVIDTSCIGTASASIKVTAKGAVEGYEVIIKELPNGPTVLGSIPTSGGMYIRTGVTSGTYSVCVTDEDGFGTVTMCDTIIIDIPTLGASLQNTQRPTCFGDSDGIVTAIVSLDGTVEPNPGLNFTFTWSPTLNPSGPVFNNASAGVYSVTISDQTTGCTATASGTLDQPAILMEQNTTVTPAACPGVPNGAITYVAKGGTPFPGGGYQYNWEYTAKPSDPPIQGPTGGPDSLIVLTDLAAGSWFVTITDANGCTFTDEVVVTNQKEVEIVLATLNNTLCAGDSTGSICVDVVETPASANPNYSFFWAPGGFPQTDVPTNSCYNDLPAGTYNVLAIDALGCAANASFEILSPLPFVLDTISLQNPNCTFQNNGAIKVQGFGGTGGPNYTYTWNPPAAGNVNMIMNLLSGDYAVTATDANGCQDSLNFTLALPPPPAITQVDSTSVKCGSDGCLSVTAPTAVTFQWQTIGGQPVGNTPQVCNLQGDTFVVTVIDNQGCSTSDTFSLAPVIPMALDTATFIQPSCFNYDDGSISVGIMDGNPPYTYLWNDSLGQTFPTLINVKAGDYILTVTDAEGCTLVDTFTLTQPPAISVSSSNSMGVSCNGVCDGSITIFASYTTNPPTFGDFNFTWENNNTDSIPTDLCAGYNTLITIDQNNCFRVDSFFIDSVPVVSFSTLSTVQTTCFGGDNGQATVQGAGGNGGPYTYNWSNGDMTATIINLVADEYTVTITDINGCTGVYTAEVTQPEEIVVLKDDQQSQDILCFGDDSGILGVTVTGGNPGSYTFAWENSDSMAVGNSQVVTNLPAGIYSVTATDSKGCTGVLQNLVLNDPPPVGGDYLPWEELVCNGDETTLYIDTIFGGSGAPYQFSLDFGVTLNPDFPVSMSGGEHYITYYDRFGCEHTDTIFVNEPAPIVVTFDSIVVEIELGDTTFQLKPIITGAVVDTFLWVPSTTLSPPNSLTPFVATYESETYVLTVFDANGCSGTGSITVNVDPNRNVFVPNVFYPGNPRGLNDHFSPQIGRGVERVSYMRVYDRWGGLMYERNDFYPNNDDFSEGWDGKYKGSYVNPAVFIYVIEVRFLDGRVLLYRGDVTVLR